MRIDYDLLKVEQKKIDNKLKGAFSESVTLASLLSLISNIIYKAEQMKMNELAMFISSLNHWVTNKTIFSRKAFKVGDIIEFECGLNYAGELAYRHTGIILSVQDNSVMVIPSTSRASCKDKSSDKKDGLWYYYLVDETYGFEYACVLLLNNMKVISKQRIISKFKNIADISANGIQVVDCIKEELVKHYFTKQHNEYQKTLANLKQDIAQIKDENKILSEQNQELASENKILEATVKNQKERMKHLYKKITFLSRK